MSTPGRRVAMFVCTTVLLAALTGCSGSDGIEQGELNIDEVTGCPVIASTFAVTPPDRHTGVSLEGSVFSSDPPEGGTVRDGIRSMQPFASVRVTTAGTHAIEMRFAYPFHQVMGELEDLRQYQRPRYAEFYRLMQPGPRAAFVATHGETALQERIAELGPPAVRVLNLQRNRDYTCDDGWWVFPRPHLGPLRVTIDETGALAFESKELSTYEVIAWCGDGCKGLPIPTGTYTGTMRWRADASNTEWRADEVAAGFAFLRPEDEIEAERKRFADGLQRSAEATYATPEQVREALTPLLPEGVAIEAIESTTLPGKGARVRVQAGPADPGMPVEDQRVRLEWFLGALREGDPGLIEDREVVKRLISGDGPMRHEFEIYLDTHPAVQRREAAEAAPSRSAAAEAGPAPAVAATYLPPPPVQAAPSVPTEPQPGYASAETIKARLASHLASGCRIDDIRFDGDMVIATGRAQTLQCISDTLRSVEGGFPAGERGPDLMQTSVEEDGRYTFKLRLPESALTKA